MFVNVINNEKASEWFKAFEFKSKTTMPESKHYEIKGKKVLFWEMHHCVHSNKVKEKQGNQVTKRTQSSRAWNINCTASIHICLESWCIKSSYPLEINIKFTYNHVVNH